MFKLYISLVIFAYIACVNADLDSRIIGGEQVPIGNFSWAVSLRRIPPPNQVPPPPPPAADRGHVCGGALITWGHVLTSATCCHDFHPTTGAATLKRPVDYQVLAGSIILTTDDPQRIRNIQAFEIAQGYIPPPTRINDIAIIVLANIFSELPNLRPINALGNSRPFDGMECDVAGFGAHVSTPPIVPSTVLRSVRKYVYNRDVCTFLYAQIPNQLNIMSSFFCAASFDITMTSARYDEGNILVCDGLAAGILTYFPGPAYQSFPEVYTRVSNYTAWIRQISAANITVPGFLISFVAILSILRQILFTS